MAALSRGILARMAGAVPMARTVVAAAIIYSGKVLAAQRRSPPELFGLWEFPGGKVESGETEFQALIRECREELGVTIAPQRFLGEVLSPYGEQRVRLWSASLSGAESERVRPLEHLELRWLGADELTDVDWLPGNRQFEAAVRPLLT